MKSILKNNFQHIATNILFQIVPAICAFLIILLSCNSEKKADTLFEKIPSSKSNITFNNTLTETDTFNYFLFSFADK